MINVNMMTRSDRTSVRPGSGRRVGPGPAARPFAARCPGHESRPRRFLPRGGPGYRGAQPDGRARIQRLVRRAAGEHQCPRWRELRRVARLARLGAVGIGGRRVHGCDHQYDRPLHLYGVGDHPARVRSAQLRDYVSRTRVSRSRTPTVAARFSRRSTPAIHSAWRTSPTRSAQPSRERTRSRSPV